MKTVLFVVISFVFSHFSFAAEEFKVATIDLQKALQTVEAGKQAKGKLEKEVAAKRTALEKEQASLQEEAEQLEKKAAILNAATRAEKQAALQKKAYEFQKKAAESQMDLQKRERELTKPIIDEISAIVETLAKEKKFNLVLEKNESGIIFSDNGTDLTDDVIAAYNKKKGKT